MAAPNPALVNDEGGCKTTDDPTAYVFRLADNTPALFSDVVADQHFYGLDVYFETQEGNDRPRTPIESPTRLQLLSGYVLLI